MHGWHQVAQKSTRTTFPSSALEIRRVPLRDSKSNVGAGCKVCAFAIGTNLSPAARTQHPASKLAQHRLAKDRRILGTHPLLLNDSQDVNLQGVHSYARC